MDKEEKMARNFLRQFTGSKKWDGIIHYGDHGQYEVDLVDLLKAYDKEPLKDKIMLPAETVEEIERLCKLIRDDQAHHVIDRNSASQILKRITNMKKE